jgi:hypothetical protein
MGRVRPYGLVFFISLFPLLLFVACGREPDVAMQNLSKTPASVRGWLLDIRPDGTPAEPLTMMEFERRRAAFDATNIAVEEQPYASGGISESGAFVVLDVPSGNAIIVFQPPGMPDAFLHLENIPPSADVLLPELVVQPPYVRLARPGRAVVRLPARVKEPRRLEQTARIAGVEVRIVEVPFSHMADRRDFPHPDDAGRPLATVK